MCRFVWMRWSVVQYLQSDYKQKSQCDVSIWLDAMICCTIFAIGLQTTVAMRCVDLVGCDDFFVQYLQSDYKQQSQCDVSIFLDAMICCTIFAIGLSTTVAMRSVDFFGCDNLLYNICNRITNNSRNAKCRFFWMRWLYVVQYLQ